MSSPGNRVMCIRQLIVSWRKYKRTDDLPKPPAVLYQGDETDRAKPDLFPRGEVLLSVGPSVEADTEGVLLQYSPKFRVDGVNPRGIGMPRYWLGLFVPSGPCNPPN